MTSNQMFKISHRELRKIPIVQNHTSIFLDSNILI